MGEMGQRIWAISRRERSMGSEWPELTYGQALAAYLAGQKLYQGDRVYLVRRALREPEEGVVLWVTDERTLGDHGLPDGRVEAR
jgi:cobalamin biosynthesis protein CobD/CbiB